MSSESKPDERETESIYYSICDLALKHFDGQNTTDVGSEGMGRKFRIGIPGKEIPESPIHVRYKDVTGTDDHDLVIELLAPLVVEDFNVLPGTRFYFRYSKFNPERTKMIELESPSNEKHPTGKFKEVALALELALMNPQLKPVG